MSHVHHRNSRDYLVLSPIGNSPRTDCFGIVQKGVAYYAVAWVVVLPVVVAWVAVVYVVVAWVVGASYSVDFG